MAKVKWDSLSLERKVIAVQYRGLKAELKRIPNGEKELRKAVKAELLRLRNEFAGPQVESDNKPPPPPPPPPPWP